MPDELPQAPRPGDVPEHQRIRQVYGAYQRDPHRRRIWSDSTASRRMREQKWSRVHALLAATRARVSGSWGLDLGSGATADADRLSADTSPLKGILVVDLLRERLLAARASNPGLVPVAGDAALLPFRTGSLGVVYQSTMISSVLDAGLRGRILAEIERILRPGGVFISYDTRYPNPWNRNTRPVGLRELRGSFGGWRQATESITGIPQLMRLLAPVSMAACRVVESLPPLRSHRLFVAVKPGPEPG